MVKTFAINAYIFRMDNSRSNAIIYEITQEKCEMNKQELESLYRGLSDHLLKRLMDEAGVRSEGIQKLENALAEFDAADKQYKSWEFVQDLDPLIGYDQRMSDRLKDKKLHESQVRTRTFYALIDVVREFIKESKNLDQT